MPFPLAHPAAVLPLRRYCRRFFNFPALVVGSLTPDLGYFFGPLHLRGFSHELLGSFLFCLPLGILCSVVLYRVWSVAARHRFEPNVRALLQRAWPSLGSPLPLVGSLLVGAWSHLFLDSFTHQTGWLAERLPLLQVSLGSVAGHAIRICSVLWFVCSFVGVSLVFVALQHWLQESFPSPTSNVRRSNWPGALLVASVVLPIELLHRLLNNLAGILLVSFLTLALLLLVIRSMWRAEVTRHAEAARPEQSPDVPDLIRK
jgi:hypothetical protein